MIQRTSNSTINDAATCFPPRDHQIDDQAPYMVKTYIRPPHVFVKGEGCYLWDASDKKYLDFTAGIAVNALGHCDSEISRIISEQVSGPRTNTLIHMNLITNKLVENFIAYI